MKNAFRENKINECKSCKNIYRNIWLKVGKDWNDFGFRFCPFCSAVTEDLAHIC
jgi:hypothetical protein